MKRRFTYYHIDELLRRHAFAIRERRRQEEPVWERSGRLFRQSEAERIAKTEEERLENQGG